MPYSAGNIFITWKGNLRSMNSKTFVLFLAIGLRKIHGVKIVSPIRGQKVPVDKNLTVIGTSIANSTSNCLVSITLNGLTPYQKVKAVGPNGTNDYSLWGFVITPKYAPIKVVPTN
jgi:hypothetical protein